VFHTGKKAIGLEWSVNDTMKVFILRRTIPLS